MKTFISNFALASVFAISLSACSDVRDIKESKMTMEQKKEAIEKMTQEEIQLYQKFEMNAIFGNAFDKTKIEDLTINEKLKLARGN